jgi:DNA polymerase-3 subunit delta
VAKQDKYSYEQIISSLKKREYHSLYFLMGEEPYYIDLITDYIQKNVLDESSREFDLTVLYGKEIDVLQIINAARRYPMMGSHQVLIIKEAQLIKEWDKFTHYLNNPLSSTILVICYKYGSPDKRNKWYQDVKKVGIVFESEKVRDYEMNKWILEYAKSKNVGIEEKAVSMLTEFLGNDLSKVAHEIEKLIITKPADFPKITPELIERNIGISKDFNVFELQNALINRDVLKANRIVRYFSENKKSNPMVLVLSQLFKFFADLMLYHYIPDKSQVAAELKINPYFVKDYERASKIFGPWKTMNIISYIRETDARFKGVENQSADEGDLLKELIFKILH